MAKSLRAKSHLKAKSIKRRSVFQKIVDARESRLAERLKKDFVDQKVKELKEKNGDAEIMDIDADGKITGEDESEISTKKVSTSGWRDARHHAYKKNKIAKKAKKKGSFTKF
ncbi:uncharacterized protein NDAI_0A05460 [Naumovozyma dairenensis CBS 421]|uniref:DUF2423 domain-containing protein n=1 Tax=Naumovozyma dairenensis (strain ATCC 10597 / BCRC 20456 / CBS 421 / NBRC 0211 / NRRL Y-12639) TaxID=1071378 RepID=G0W4G3_NAUDC|nr:hypothetical protein NDAI_0A05460 [Naumovozyma dairenensis CBS 421]CCD22701.1 hypothetical protein NDAI_0A05460 [Naumovozyma dairenensis CBS 421]